METANGKTIVNLNLGYLLPSFQQCCSIPWKDKAYQSFEAIAESKSKGIITLSFLLPAIQYWEKLQNLTLFSCFYTPSYNPQTYPQHHNQAQSLTHSQIHNLLSLKSNKNGIILPQAHLRFPIHLSPFLPHPSPPPPRIGSPKGAFWKVAQKEYINLEQLNFLNIIKSRNMSEMEQNARHKKRYSKISTEKRIRLVEMVLDQGFTITRAAKLLHVKRPTAKIILKRYQQNGTFFNKKMPETKSKCPLPLKEELEDEQKQNQSLSQEKEESVELKVEENEELTPQSTNPLGSYGPYTFVYYYQPFFDYHCFM